MAGTYAFDQSWDQEQLRLRFLEGWMDPGTIRHLTDLGVRVGSRCLEVGGGRGSIARWMSNRVGSFGRVLVTDLETTLLADINEPQVEVRCHDITTGAPEPEAFDFAHTRFVLGWIPERDKAARNIIDSLAPGGWFMIEELDQISHAVVTPSDAYGRVREANSRVMAAIGYEMEGGRYLPGRLTELGLEDVEAEGRIVFGSRTRNAGIEQFKLTLERTREMMVASGAASHDDVDEAIRVLGDPEFVLIPPAIVACWGRKPR